MSRWITVLGTLCIVIVGITVLAMGMTQSTSPGDLGTGGSAGSGLAPRQAQAAQRVQPTTSGQGPVVEAHNLPGSARPLVIPDCGIVAVYTEEVPSLREGPLLFIATETEPGEVVPKDREFILDAELLARKVDPNEIVSNHDIITIPGNPQRYRRIQYKEPVDAEDLVILPRMSQVFRRLTVGDRVKSGQMLALVDPRYALDEVGSKQAKVLASIADQEASEQTAREAKNRFDTALYLFQQPTKSVSREEKDGALLQWKRYEKEAITKKHAIEVSRLELRQARTALDYHAIRSSIDGVIQSINKKTGEAVKNLESILSIQNPDWLRIEGKVDVQHARHLEKGMEVIVEPSKLEKPLMELAGHLQLVTSVAVSSGAQPLIASGGEDRSVRIWDSADGKHLFTLREFPTSIRALACTSGGERLLLVGTASGAGWLWNLDRLMGKQESPSTALVDQHKGPITCAAFSPDGKLCATGGDDRQIIIWDARSGARLHTCPPEQGHRGAVTSLHFASGTELISVGSDKTILVWNLRDGSPARIREFRGRSGAIADLGVSPDGKRVLFDQGKDLQILSLATSQSEGVLHNSSSGMEFTTLALFSPNDGKLILTASGRDNRLQLYRTPTHSQRSAEVRQLVWPAAANCGAFDPNGKFVVTGMKDGSVLVWKMPDPKEVDQDLKARITLVDKSLDSHDRKVRIWAELANPGYLMPGDTATLVIEPKK